MDNKVTLRDIAREAHLSVSAVSLVLNNQPCRISPENKIRIRNIAKARNYSANQVARSLVTKKTHTLGLILPDIENMFFSSLAKNLEENCRRAGYVLIITNSNDSCKNDSELVRMLTARGVDGLFLIVSNESYRTGTKLLDEIRSLPIPYMMLDRVFPEFPCDQVLFDNEAGAYKAVRHLLENGHRKIACIGDSEYSDNCRRRVNGYLKAMEEYDCEVRPEYIIKGDFHIQSGYCAGEKFLKTDATAVFVCNDMMSLGLLKRFREEGVRVPRDYSLVSYDNTLTFFLTDPEITSVEQNISKLGNCAFSLMLDRLNGKTGDPVRHVLMPELIRKGSVSRLQSEVRKAE